MSVRVLARIRPLLKDELDKDTIVTAESTTGDENSLPNVIRIPNPKNEAESFSFQFQSVYDRATTQQELFDREVSPTVKHVFNGFDVTIFAYGVTGTGKTHTMRGGKSLADRGVIPRLLSSIYRRCRKLEKDGDTQVEVSLSYYEIYNDRVYDLFEPPEKRTAAGLPIRDNNGKTVVVGLTERPCTTLKDFEKLYDEANLNRSTSATKLNAHSSRSHAILCVQVTQTTATHTRVSKVSCIDLAGSEDNRRTDNKRERLVESSAINKSLFVLAQCVEAISKKHSRIPYRESKMTRILSLGQNNGLTLMVLNLAPVRSYHLDTLSSLNFANRTKKIEVAEVENEAVLRGPPKTTSAISGTNLQQRQPLRALAAATNANIAQNHTQQKKIDKPAKAFSVYSDKHKSVKSAPTARSDPLKRGATHPTLSSKVTKPARPVHSSGYGKPTPLPTSLSQEAIEALIERRLEEKLAERALHESSTIQTQDVSEAVRQRLEALEERVGKTEDGRAEGLHFLLMAKQHHVRGEDVSALKMYQLALPHFPENEKLSQKIVNLQEKIRLKKEAAKASTAHEPHSEFVEPNHVPTHTRPSTLAKQPLRRPAPEHVSAPEERSFAAPTRPVARKLSSKKEKPATCETHQDTPEAEIEGYDDSFVPEDDGAASDYHEQEDSFVYKPKVKVSKKPKMKIFRDNSNHGLDMSSSSGGTSLTPRTRRLLDIINTREVSQIRLLKGVGAKKAEAIVNSLCEMDGSGADDWLITDLEQLGGLKGVGLKTVENMRAGLAC
ncbi:Kinesin-like protein KIF22 [Diplodia seriata]|uniref:Kinesin-like protein KIF22 n=1 Tax=Diplodia seriata TaxID=420778 RepID=A0A1S8B1R7_9PEZI|nr:Kinesin-like protein KIF22 [Diplodia seriata]